MRTKNHRLQIALDGPDYDALAALARAEGMLMSLKARDLIREQLEDLALAAIVAERAKKPGKLLTLAQVEARFSPRRRQV